jgi:hypothetical protein
VTPLLLPGILAELTGIRFLIGVINKLEVASLASTVLFIALLAKVSSALEIARSL